MILDFLGTKKKKKKWNKNDTKSIFVPYVNVYMIMLQKEGIEELYYKNW